jgi:hypothetical protein
MKLSALKRYMRYVSKTRPTVIIVGEWKDSRTGEVLNITGFGGRTRSGQIAKYADFLLKKAEFVKQNRTNTSEFFKFMMEQNDGCNPRLLGLGFASYFPHGSEDYIEFDFIEFNADQRDEAKEIYRYLKQVHDPKPCVDVECPRDVVPAVRYLKAA